MTALVRTLARAALLALFAAPAFAAPVLKPDITVTTPVVTVADMFDAPGDFAAKPLFRAPAPGTSGEVSLAQVTAAAARIGLVDFDSAGLDGVRVARFGVPVTEDMLKSLVAADLGRRGLVADGATARTRFDRSLGALNADSRDRPASLVELNYASSSGQFAARFRIAGRTAPLDMTGRVDFMVEVPHLIGSQPAGKILTPSDVEMRPVPVGFADNGSFASLDQVVGKQLRHPARDGLMLRPADVADPLVVARNDTVTLYLKSGPMTLSVRGQALNDAAVGQKVSVLNLMSSKVVNGIAVATGAVEIGGHSATIANL